MNPLSINDDALRIMLTMRSLIISEFGASLSLHEHTPAEFCNYGIRSNKSRLRELTLQLAEITDSPLPVQFLNAPTKEPDPGDTTVETASRQRMYRGQSIEPTEPPDRGSTTDKTPSSAKRYYRGSS